MMTTEVQTVQSLETLASEINAEHEQCVEALQTGVQHALNAGQLLVEAKSQGSPRGVGRMAGGQRHVL